MGVMGEGCGTWTGDIREAVEQCDKMQNYFWRVILTVPESCPKVALRSETGQLGMKWRIWQEKIFLLQRIMRLEEKTLAKKVYIEGRANHWPGLWKEVTKICEEIQIDDVNEKFVSKEVVREAIRVHHYKEMKVEMDRSKKLEEIKHDDFTTAQTYMSIRSVEVGRTAFKVRCKMLLDFPPTAKESSRMMMRVSSVSTVMIGL